MDYISAMRHAARWSKEEVLYRPVGRCPRPIFADVERDFTPLRIRTFAEPQFGISPAELNVAADAVEVALEPGRRPTAAKVRVLAQEGEDLVLELS